MPTLRVRKLRPKKLKDTDITKFLLCARIYGRTQGFSAFRLWEVRRPSASEGARERGQVRSPKCVSDEE